MQHQTVLQTEAIELLNIAPTDTVADCTLGSGGHARAILDRLAGGTLLGIDVDADALRDNESLTANQNNTVHLVHDSFRNLSQILAQFSITSVNAIVADLGWRSEQFATGNRGLSFHREEPLLMTLGDPQQYPFTARDIVNDWSEESLANIFYGYGEERAARRIAKVIVHERTAYPIETSVQLANLIANAVPKRFWPSRIHPATKCFQALRIAVNDELAALEMFVPTAIDRLAPGGRLVIITFHSIEDRIVKRTFRDAVHDQLVHQLTKKPVTPTEEEIATNPRARSAKLRSIERL